MPTIALCSDLHLEHEHRGAVDLLTIPEGRTGHPSVGPRWEHAKGKVDFVVLAGDIDNAENAVVYASMVSVYLGVPVALVPGNHEFYNHVRPETLARMREVSKEIKGDVHVLDRDEIVLHGVRILGATLWTDYKLMGSQSVAMYHAGISLNDHRVIYEAENEIFTPGRALVLHDEAVSWLRSALERTHDGPTIVVTHHSPSARSVHPRYEGSVVNACFASNLEELMINYAPTLWMHGHMHNKSDYTVEQTRVIANPRGYWGLEPGADASFAAVLLDLPV